MLSPAMEEPKVIKAILKMARKSGINPKKLYILARDVRSHRLPPAPSVDEIFTPIKRKKVKFPKLPTLKGY